MIARPIPSIVGVTPETKKGRLREEAARVEGGNTPLGGLQLATQLACCGAVMFVAAHGSRNEFKISGDAVPLLHVPPRSSSGSDGHEQYDHLLR